jgi:hypothetical protein
VSEGAEGITGSVPAHLLAGSPAVQVSCARQRSGVRVLPTALRYPSLC